jgi:hypothetical protein
MNRCCTAKRWRVQCHNNLKPGQPSVNPKCGLTLRSSGPPPAGRSSQREYSLSGAASRFRPLTSNVRQTQSARRLSQPSTSNHALMRVSRTNAAQSAANTPHRWREACQELVEAVESSNHGALVAEYPASSRLGSPRAAPGSGSRACAFVPGLYARRQAAQCWSASAHVKELRFQASGAGCSVPSFTRSLPNPSLERTATGLALGPRGFSGYRPPRGPSANPAPAAQLKR